MSLHVVIRSGGFHQDYDDSHLVGFWPAIDEILASNNNCIRNCYGRIYHVEKNNECIIEISKGNLLLKSLKFNEIELSFPTIRSIRIVPPDGTHYTIFEQLKPIDLYLRIREFYRSIINHSKQQDFILNVGGDKLIAQFGWPAVQELIS